MSDAVAVTDAPARGMATIARRIWDAFLRRREASVLVVAIGLVVYFQASTPIFLTADNLRNIAQATAPTAIVAVGIVFLLVSGLHARGKLRQGDDGARLGHAIAREEVDALRASRLA